jgi:GAF domain-containing protein
LELVNIRAQRRASQLQAISDVAKTISTIRSLNELLPRITKAVSEQFGFYHVGIFLTDENNRYAILSATNSEGGQRMLARGHRLEVGGQGIVGHVTSTGNPRIALDTGTDAAHFSNPDLPDTHSEMAFPLKVGGRVIGALDIQSNQVNAFSQEDVDALATLADQISIAIETARLFETTQKSIAEAETLYRQYLREGWSLVSQKEIAGFRYSAVGATPLDAPMQQEEIQAAASTGQIMMGTGDRAFVAIPIKLRDEIIGVLNIQTPGKRVWKNEEISMVQAIADRIAVSAENARLFEESQQRATKERIIGEISSKISSSVNLENVMQTAAEELGRALSNSEVTIQFKKS